MWEENGIIPLVDEVWLLTSKYFVSENSTTLAKKLNEAMVGATAEFKDRSIEHSLNEPRGTVSLQQAIRYAFPNSLLQVSVKSDIKLSSKTESDW